MNNGYIKENAREQRRDRIGVFAVITLAITLFALVVHADWRDSMRCSESGIAALQKCTGNPSLSAMEQPAKGAIAPITPKMR